MFMRLRETIVEHQRKAEKVTLKMNWIVVTEHGKQQLRMMWTDVSPSLTVVNREEPGWRHAQSLRGSNKCGDPT
jgi:hypothetical protein